MRALLFNAMHFFSWVYRWDKISLKQNLARKLRSVAQRQSSKPRELLCVISDGAIQGNFDKFSISTFWLRTISHLPPTIPESLTQIGPGMCEIISKQSR